MHTTTVRFPVGTWSLLKERCGEEGVATAQYIREATTARLLNHPVRSDERIAQELQQLSERVVLMERALRRHLLTGR
ncbi:hypothetical protein Q5424_17425 [Conexibacter sp. JD483]|uniref:hypothetical protein n=1 Tax=unclassified Conexibacter TaxID=2627773 RepID=UPI0027206D61|nr:MULTISPECIES: hypothetical protein [unclassified Conexibacter]MDO8186474.1 hypothetical protein [Conexibacter sp. CPCC 205706]MDO8200043.1 hypothetical protein [Conexibacter sp. CPCC 205762]MDR9370881.1 hypothetical protein [Conexibacter sp. JD483]